MYILSTIARAWRTRRNKKRIGSQLRSLDDHLLRDIGIRRDEINHYAGTVRYEDSLDGTR